MSAFSKLAGVVKGAAPLLGSVLGLAGPAGAVAGRLVAAALGTPEGDEDAALAAVAANPDAVLKLKELEARHAEELERLQLETTRLELQDRQGARNREIAITQVTGKRDINLVALAWVMIAGFLVLTAVLTFWPPKPDATGVVFMLYGSLSASFGAVVQYYFGSSAGSKAKDALVAKATNGK
mgnify:CR=1 FL=1